jgi:predicted DNA-binding protein (UPF0278 family)
MYHSLVRQNLAARTVATRLNGVAELLAQARDLAQYMPPEQFREMKGMLILPCLLPLYQ